MLKRTLTLLAVSFVALQAINGALTPYDLYDEAYIILEDLKAQVNASYLIARNRLENHVQEVLVSVSTLEAVSNAQIDISYNTLLLQVETIKEQNADNELLEGCLEGRESLLPEIEQSVKDHLVVCIVLNSDAIRSRLVQAEGALAVVDRRVDVVERELIDCGRTDVLCIAGIIGVVPDLTATLPRSIIQIVDNATLEIDNSLFDLERCAIQDTTSVVTIGDQVVDAIRTCLQGTS